MDRATFLYNPAIDHGTPTHWGVLAGQFHQPSTYEVHRPRGTHDWLMTFTLSGQGGFSTDGEPIIVQANDMTLLAPGCPHHYGTIGNSWAFYWVHFVAQPSWVNWLESIDRDNRFSNQQLADAVLIQRIHEIFHRLVADSVGLSVYQHALASNAVEQLLILLAASVERHPRQLDPRVHKVLVTLNEHYAQPVEIADLAHLVGLSPSRLSHVFKSETGASIVATVQQIRLRQAARLLARTSFTVNDIADQVGFTSPFYFSKQFRSAYGMSPTAYRRKAIESSETPSS